MENCKEKFFIVLPSLNEKQKKLLVGAEAIALGTKESNTNLIFDQAEKALVHREPSGHFVTAT